MRYELPKMMRYSTLEERQNYYKKEFRFKKVEKWMDGFRDPLNTAYVVIIGRHTHIYPKEFSDAYNVPVVIDRYEDKRDIMEMITEFKPEGVYYDRNYYKNVRKCAGCKYHYTNCWGCKNFLGQELAFDLDPENLVCPIHGSLDEKMKKHQGLSFCELEFEMVREQAVKLYERLERDYEEINAVYSGRGFHLHVFDEKTIKMSKKERRNLTTQLLKEKFAIDEWVTNGNMRLIRLPYSLHGMVSRIVLPIKNKKELKKVDPIRDKSFWPKFLI